MWNQKAYREFVMHVHRAYDADEISIAHMLDEEIAANLALEPRKTAKAKIHAMERALANCRAWLAEPRRKETMPEHIASFRRSALYFGMIEKRMAKGI